jgi:hypothetical protein
LYGENAGLKNGGEKNNALLESGRHDANKIKRVCVGNETTKRFFRVRLFDDSDLPIVTLAGRGNAFTSDNFDQAEKATAVLLQGPK